MGRTAIGHPQESATDFQGAFRKFHDSAQPPPPFLYSGTKSSGKGMTLTLRRRWLQLQRFYRTRTVTFGLFCAVFLFFLFLIAYIHDGTKDVEHDTAEANNRAQRLSASEINPGELPGGMDPQSVFRDGVLGNFEPKEPEKASNQPGENGEPVRVDGGAAAQRAINEFGFNTYVSDMISLNRTIPDLRMDECKYWSYPEKLPTVSVVVVFHNEGWTPLLRTVHSVLNRSPPQFLQEVVMVDDYSDKEHLKEKLEKYIARFNGRVRLVRTADREGLIRARTIGAQNARADVVVFLDAHCEVGPNWLPPLLAPIRRNRKVMTVPVIDGIDMNTWAYRRVYGAADKHFRGIFEWGLLYKETELSGQELENRAHHSQPFRSPTHAGGLFAIDRRWFEELGYYDDGLQIWGGEQYELSFKIWQCGGGILFVPCSHVGHVYRHHMPYSFGKLQGKPVISTNMVRVVKTWMGDYGKYYYIREPSAKHRDPGDLTKQIALKERLQCKSFKWFMENVAYDVPVSYPLLPENHVWGEAKNPATGKCIDTMGRAIPGIVGATPCHGYGGNQLLRINNEGQFCQGEWCITPYGREARTGHCTKGTAAGPWRYNEATQQVVLSSMNTCLTAAESMSEHALTLETCDDDNPLQRFVWKQVFTD